MKYTVEGKITISVSVEVFADDEKSAELLAKNVLNDSYHLDSHGMYHNVESDVKFDLDSHEDD